MTTRAIAADLAHVTRPRTRRDDAERSVRADSLVYGARIGQSGALGCEGSKTVLVLSPADHRTSLWTYYDRRAADYEGGVSGAFRYFHSLGVDVTPKAIRDELREVTRQLVQLAPATFIDIGAGPGVFTAQLRGSGFALDQSEQALRRLRVDTAGVPVLRADATALPVTRKAVARVFAGHLYGHLEPSERGAFVPEVRRVADELVILDSGLPQGARAEEWQQRALPGGTTHTVYKRHFDVDALANEIGGEPLFGGRYYVLVRAVW